MPDVSDRGICLVASSIELVEVVGRFAGPERLGNGSPQGDWPCPLCRRRSPIGDAWNVRVRNRVGSANERTVVVCDPCLPDLRDAAERSTATAH